LGDILKFLGLLLLENLSIAVRSIDYSFCFSCGGNLFKAFINTTLMFILYSWLSKFKKRFEDLLVECDFEAYMIDLNAFRDELNGD
jgi:hypothetical protein